MSCITKRIQMTSWLRITPARQAINYGAMMKFIVWPKQVNGMGSRQGVKRVRELLFSLLVRVLCWWDFCFEELDTRHGITHYGKGEKCPALWFLIKSIPLMRFQQYVKQKQRDSWCVLCLYESDRSNSRVSNQLVHVSTFAICKIRENVFY